MKFSRTSLADNILAGGVSVNKNPDFGQGKPRLPGLTKPPSQILRQNPGDFSPYSQKRQLFDDIGVLLVKKYRLFHITPILLRGVISRGEIFAHRDLAF